MSVAADLASVVIEEYLAPQPGLAADYWAFVTEATVRRHIEGSLRVPGQFADTTAELYTRARLRRDGFDAELRPPPGGRHRDQLGKRRDPGRSETPQCQRSAQGRSRAIETANRQIKRRSSGAGVAVVVLSRSAAPGTDTMPDDVQDYVQEIRASISGAHQRSVARVLLAWDDYMVMGEAPAQQLVVFRRHTHAIEHANPRAVLPGELDSIRLGGSAGFWITWQSHQ